MVITAPYNVSVMYIYITLYTNKLNFNTHFIIIYFLVKIYLIVKIPKMLCHFYYLYAFLKI